MSKNNTLLIKLNQLTTLRDVTTNISLGGCVMKVEIIYQGNVYFSSDSTQEFFHLNAGMAVDQLINDIYY